MDTLTPAYGRDYTSKAKVLADWDAGKDFIINNMFSRWDGKPMNQQDWDGGMIQFRYAKLTKTFTISRTPGK